MTKSIKIFIHCIKKVAAVMKKDLTNPDPLGTDQSTIREKSQVKKIVSAYIPSAL